MIETYAFAAAPECSYNEKINHLTFANRDARYLSYFTSHSIPIRHKHVSDDYKTILMCHGNGADVGHFDLEMLSRTYGANICVFDYAGYGLHSCKESSEENCQNDVIAVYEYLVLQKKINPENIYIFGRSLGTYMACFLAHHTRNHKKSPQKLILVSPLMSGVGVVTDLWTPIDKFMNYALAPEIKCSTLILHGDKDEIVPYSCGHNLSKNFPNLYKFYTLKNCGHNDVSTYAYYDEINKFLKS